MKHLIAIFALALVGSAFAKTTTITCAMKKYPKEKFTFAIESNASESKVELVYTENEEQPAVQTKSKNDTIIRYVDTLNGQGGDLRNEGKTIRLWGDSAGIDFSELVLYKDSGYKAGFARIDFDFHNERDYSTVTCTTKVK